MPEAQPRAEAAGGTIRDKGSTTEAILGRTEPQQTTQIVHKDTAEAPTPSLDLGRIAGPPSDRYDTAPSKRPRRLLGLGILGAGIAITLGIGSYAYLAGSLDQTPDLKQEQQPVADAAPESAPPERTPSSVGNSPAEVSTDTPDPSVAPEPIQDVDSAQILALAEEKVSEARRRGTESGSPKRGNRKTARAANARGLSYLQSGQTAAAINAFQEGHQADPADVEILNNLGHACLMQGDLASAERYFLSVLTFAPERTPAWSDLGQVYARRGDTRNAVASFANAYQFSQNREKTHQFFLGLMEKDPNLKQALQQVTRFAAQQFLTTATQ